MLTYWKRLMLRKIHQLNRYEVEQTPGNSRGNEPGVQQSTGSQRVGPDLVNEQQQNALSVIFN